MRYWLGRKPWCHAVMIRMGILRLAIWSLSLWLPFGMGWLPKGSEDAFLILNTPFLFVKIAPKGADCVESSTIGVNQHRNWRKKNRFDQKTVKEPKWMEFIINFIPWTVTIDLFLSNPCENTQVVFWVGLFQTMSVEILVLFFHLPIRLAIGKNALSLLFFRWFFPHLDFLLPFISCRTFKPRFPLVGQALEGVCGICAWFSWLFSIRYPSASAALEYCLCCSSLVEWRYLSSILLSWPWLSCFGGQLSALFYGLKGSVGAAFVSYLVLGVPYLLQLSGWRIF